MFSYYEFKWPMSDRLTDDEWTNMLATSVQPARPDWVSSFVKPVALPPGNANAVPCPRLTKPRVTQSGVNVEWNAVTGNCYRVFYSDDLGSDGWYLLQSPVNAITPTAGLMDTNVVSCNHRFYKVMLIP